MWYLGVLCSSVGLLIVGGMIKFCVCYLQDKGVLLTTYDIVRNNSKSLRGEYDFDDGEDGVTWDYMILDEVFCYILYMWFLIFEWIAIFFRMHDRITIMHTMFCAPTLPYSLCTHM